jgi:hypothetical protein
MDAARPIPDHILLSLNRGRGKTPRIIGYRAAAWLYGLDGIDELVPEYLIPHGAWRRGPHDHQRRRLDDIEVVEVEGVLVTSVRQTLGDLCAVADLDIVERAVECALRKELVAELDLRDFAAIFAFARHGTPALCDVLDRRPIGAPPTGSDLETRCLQVLRAGGVPTPIRQFPVINQEGEVVATADFGWYRTYFVIETDGLGTHKTREQQLFDLHRQNRMSDAGYDFRRFTYTHVTRVPKYVVRETMRGLARAGLDLSKMRKRAV